MINKQQINYKNALVRLYDVPALYFPKFFHPDPVKRQSGFLRPALNNSNVFKVHSQYPTTKFYLMKVM